MRLVLCDLDGTISDDRWRKEFIQDKYFAKYHQCLGDDIPYKNVVDTICFRHSIGHLIYFTTARPSDYRKSTKMWLDRHLPNMPFNLQMRKGEDTRPSPLVKRDMVSNIISSNLGQIESITIIDDERENLIEMSGIALRYLSHDQIKLIIAHNGQLRQEKGEPTGYLPEAPNIPKPPPPPEPEEKALTVPQRLGRLADIYEERNALYGDNYIHFGALWRALEDCAGKGFVARTDLDKARLGIWVQLVSKFSRYAAQFNSGGHPDTLDDISVYAQMLQELDAKPNDENIPF